MTLRQTIATAIGLVAILLVLNEIAYYWWRRINRGEHWSHLQGDFDTLITYPPFPRGEGVLNNQWRLH